MKLDRLLRKCAQISVIFWSVLFYKIDRVVLFVNNVVIYGPTCLSIHPVNVYHIIYTPYTDKLKVHDFRFRPLAISRGKTDSFCIELEVFTVLKVP